MDDKKISGISCKVSDCKYHKGDDCCEAGCIEVIASDGCHCSCESDTACKTFEKKNI